MAANRSLDAFSIALSKNKTKVHTFEDLETAIKSKQFHKVAIILDKNPNYLTQYNDEDESPLHIALNIGDNEITSYIINMLKKEFAPKIVNQIFHSITESGNTALHLAIAKSNSDITECVLNSYSDYTEIMHQANDEGQLPIHLLSKRLDDFVEDYNNIENDEKVDSKQFNLENKTIEEISLLLEPHLINKTVKELSAHLQLKEILDQFKVDIANNKELAFNLYYGCMAVNLTRNRIMASSTHPSTNELDKEASAKITASCVSLREITTRMLKEYVDRMEDVENTSNDIDLLKDKIHFDLITKTAEEACKAELGDCYVFAMTTALMLLSMGVKSSIQLANLKPTGDHNFIVLGDGENAVIIDAWAGEVYPLKYASQYLHGYINYYSFGLQREMNYIFPIDSKVHEINLDCLLWKFSENFLKNNEVNAGYFTKDEEVVLNKDKRILDTYLTTQQFLGETDHHLSRQFSMYSPAQMNKQEADVETTLPKTHDDVNCNLEHFVLN